MIPQRVSAKSAVLIPQRSVRCDINVTPLIDVCLVLLIVFMVITPLISKGSAVQLPETRNPLRLTADTPRISVSLEQNGLVFIDRQLVTEERLEGALRDLAAANPDRQVLVAADHRLPYRDVRRLVVRLQAAGWSKVALAADRRLGSYCL